MKVAVNSYLSLSMVVALVCWLEVVLPQHFFFLLLVLQKLLLEFDIRDVIVEFVYYISWNVRHVDEHTVRGFRRTVRRCP